jgi:hypothetical protein
MTIPVIPDEPSVAHSTIPTVNISHPTSNSAAPDPVKVASHSKSDHAQISESKEVDEESDESDESNESDESSESQESKEEASPPHLANVTESVQAAKASMNASVPTVQEIKTDLLSPTSVSPTSPTAAETAVPLEISEPDVTVVSMATIISDVTFLPSLKPEPEVPLLS